jgi:hypothetical protein
MEENKFNDNDKPFTKMVRAGRRKYFFDVRETKTSDYYITITESKKRFDDHNFVKQKIFLYKEDFNKFAEALQETIDFVKQELLPEYNFDEFANYKYEEEDVQSKPLDTDFNIDFDDY